MTEESADLVLTRNEKIPKMTSQTVIQLADDLATAAYDYMKVTAHGGGQPGPREVSRVALQAAIEAYGMARVRLLPQKGDGDQ